MPKNDPKMVPKRVPKWSQNPQKWGLGSTLFQGWLPRGLQSPSRIDFGEVLGPFSTIFLIYFWCLFHAFCSSMLQTNTFKIARHHQKNPAESFQETASLFVPSCIGKFTSEGSWAFWSLLVQVDTRQASTMETGLCLVSILNICLVSTADRCPVSSRHLSCLNSRRLSCLNRRHLSCQPVLARTRKLINVC